VHSKILKHQFLHPGPTLYFDLAGIKEFASRLKHICERSQVKLLPAVKGVSAAPLLETLAPFVDGWDVSNAHEAQLIENFRQDKLIWLTSPVPQASFCADQDFIYDIDSVHELAKMKGQRFSLRLDAGELLGKAHGRFGLGLEELRPLLSDLKNWQGWQGLHVHYGSEVNTLEDYLGLSEAIQSFELEPRFFNIGGGLHHLGEENLPTLFSRLREHWPGPTQICIEPGRLLTEKFGMASGRVLSVKKRAKESMAVVELSALCHLNWSSPKLKARPGSEKLSLFGPTCYEGDLIGVFEVAEIPQAGESLLLENVSAYSLGLNRAFNGIEKSQVHFFS
jgi:diaminopimelate decarboxylase